MSERKWTNEQNSAINTSNSKDSKKCNILVSAAAGSGKTAVLVERIIRKLLPDDGTSGTDINKLLVVTFTNAAAQEMKDRINKALSLELKNAREKSDKEKITRLKRQMLLLHTADITTIDAFCMKIVRENFSILDIDPGFSIADSGQAAILADEATEELFSRLLDEKNDDFLLLMDLYASASSHRNLADLVKYIYNYTRSIPFPMDWLKEKTEQLSYEHSQFKETEIYKDSLQDAKIKLSELLESTKKALTMICETNLIDEFIANNPPEKNVAVYDMWGAYYKAFYQDYLLLLTLLSSDEPGKVINNHTFSTLSANKRISEEQKNYLKAIREKTKNTVKSIGEIFSPSCDEAEKLSREKIYPVAKALFFLVSEFDKTYTSKKISMNLLEFHDVEQLTAELFKNNHDICMELQARYDEILMDEYQDTSLLQEEIFSRIKKPDNIFMVGDMKQSIYRFRSSDPSIFSKKIEAYSETEGASDRKIILSNNFRSRGIVLEGINDVFEAIMTKIAGELDYDEGQKLHQICESYKDHGQNHKSVFVEIIAENDDNSDESPEKTQLEARYIASEINRLKSEHFQVRDGDSYRDIENRDFVILLSYYKNIAEIYANELNDAGIDCHAESTGYFEQSEIRLMMSLLEIIINPHSDIPLIGVLRSPVASFTDDEIVIIRKCKKGTFYHALKEIINLNEKGAISAEDEIKAAEKAGQFIENLNRWRKYSRYMPTDKLVWTLYEETDFYAFSGAMYDGETVQANLRLLFLRAKQYEDNGFRGLFNFIRYLDNLKQRDANLTSAKLLGENNNAVRIMTIHKSKGLEMPVVFIAGCGNKFRLKSESSRIALHKSYGIGLDLISYEHRYKTETIQKKLIKSAIRTEEISEEIRKLYVAMTRAKEKLYVISSHTHDALKSESSAYSKKQQQWESCIEEGYVNTTPFYVLSSDCYADWVAPVAENSDNWEKITVPCSSLEAPSFTPEDAQTDDVEIDIDNLLSYSYPYAEVSTLPTKVTVTQLKGSRETTMIPVPDFLTDKTETGAFYGTATHNFISCISLTSDMSPEYIASQLILLEENGTISPKEARKINIDKVYKFFTSDLGKRMLSSKNVCREQPFEVSLPANVVYPEVKNADGESIILQGIIDCYFEEDDGLVLIDYKTDSFKSTDEIHEKYDLQLDLYALALEKITEKKVKNKFFYLFFDNSVIE